MDCEISNLQGSKQYVWWGKGEGGLIGYFKRKYGLVRLDAIDSEEYELMRSALHEIQENGQLSKNIVQKLKKLENILL